VRRLALIGTRRTPIRQEIRRPHELRDSP
jgi:hypothetical protein